MFPADVFNFLAMATANLLALAFASGSKAQTEKVMNDSLMAALMVGVASGAAYFHFAPQCVAMMAGSGGAALVEPASQYVQIRALGLVAFMATSVLQVPAQPHNCPVLLDSCPI
jgi:Na+-driven multidrug efflux pump